jgi:hypothetical protein
MRLLTTNGTLLMHQFSGSAIPPYAILSHTWGSDELTSRDLVAGSGQETAGWPKLAFCATIAASDDLRYCWLDTCCIDKTSSAELTEAINSIFEWYRDAAVCYVFLSDVYVGPPGLAGSEWLRNFRIL